jgi:S-adenosylmethionine:tRNA ribosyltransferase-isomerase
VNRESKRHVTIHYPRFSVQRFANEMHIDQFDYILPPDLIAQEPCATRDESRLLVLQRGGAVLAHRQFRDLPELLKAGDLLVLNDTYVIPARLLGRRARTEGKWEGLFLRETPDGSWELLCQTRGRLIVGETILVDAPHAAEDATPLRLCLVGKSNAGHWVARPEESGSAAELLARFGHVPLPPYIRKGRAVAADQKRYQTVYAKHAGAVAAPTAGLHFTPELLELLRQQHIDSTFVTLHVGPGTFQPVQAEDVTAHRVEQEWGELPTAAVEAIRACKARGGRVVAVGTTSVRVLETAAQRDGELQTWSGETDLTICPPFRFNLVDALLTNFHLPRSSLLLLVAAFTGLESMQAAYAAAIAKCYRFYSYGDAMLIVPG